ncbi:MAG: hypothetical protein AAGH15_22740 [Myxococcota bacterium]
MDGLERTSRGPGACITFIALGLAACGSPSAETDAGPDDAGAAMDEGVDAGVDQGPDDLGVDGGRGPAWEGPRLSGQFLLGPDDYDAHVAKTGAGTAVVHFFPEWLYAVGVGAATLDPTTRVEPRPLVEGELAFLDFAFRPGTTVAISWAMPLAVFDVPAAAWPNVPTVRDLLSGRYDDYVRTFAREIGRLESDVMLTMFGEFDNNAFYAYGPEGLHAPAPDPDVPAELQVPVAEDLRGHYGDPTVPDGPERVRDAFIRVIGLFREEGVTDVRWFMYGSSGFLGTTDEDRDEELTPVLEELNQVAFFYPGDEYIDFVGKSLHHDGLASLRARFEGAYAAWGAVTGRPFFSPEFSINEGVGVASRAALIAEEFGTYFPSFPRFAGFAMVDQDPVTGDDTFGLVTLGGEEGEFPDEVAAWREHVVDAEGWAVVR